MAKSKGFLMIAILLICMLATCPPAIVFGTTKISAEFSKANKYVEEAETYLKVSIMKPELAVQKMDLAEKAVTRLLIKTHEDGISKKKLMVRIISLKSKLKIRLVEAEKIKKQETEMHLKKWFEEYMANGEEIFAKLSDGSDYQTFLAEYNKVYNDLQEVLKSMTPNTTEYKKYLTRFNKLNENVLNLVQRHDKAIEVQQAITELKQQLDDLTDSMDFETDLNKYQVNFSKTANELRKADLDQGTSQSFMSILASMQDRVTSLKEANIKIVAVRDAFQQAEKYLLEIKTNAEYPTYHAHFMVALGYITSSMEKLDKNSGIYLKFHDRKKQLEEQEKLAYVEAEKVAEIREEAMYAGKTMTEAGVITFRDKNLEKALREAINKPIGDLLFSDFEKIVSIQLGVRKISDISGLENLTSLKRISLRSNDLKNIRPLEKLVNLEYVDISYNKIQSLKPLLALNKLQELHLYSNEVTDLSPLANAMSLKVLNVKGNKVSNLEPLRNLTSLRKLWLMNNQISDYTPASEYYWYLLEKDFTIPDLNNPVVAFADPNLEKAIRDSIKKPSGELHKSDVANITYFMAYKQGIQRLDGLENLSCLEILGLNDNQVSNLESLKSLKYLMEINLDSNPVTDLTPIGGLSNLKKLYLTRTEVLDLNPIRSLRKLETLNLGYCRVESIDALKDMSELFELYMEGCPIKELPSFVGLPKLKSIGWFGTSSIQEAQELCQKANQILRQILVQGMTEYQKELAIHDYIVDHAKYDYDNFLKNTIPRESYTAAGVLLLGIGVCSGYADATSLLLGLAGIKNYVVTGQADGVGGWGAHAWNIVCIDGVYYQLDTTWDDPFIASGDVKLYSYFNVTDEILRQDHRFDSTGYPPCTDTKYHFLNNR